MSMAERSMGLGLRALGRLAGSDVVDRLGVRKPAEKVLYRATRDGFKAAGAAGRTFKSVNGGRKAQRLPSTTSTGSTHPGTEGSTAVVPRVVAPAAARPCASTTGRSRTASFTPG